MLIIAPLCCSMGRTKRRKETEVNKKQQERLMHRLKEALDAVMPGLPRFIWFSQVEVAVEGYLDWGRRLTSKEYKVLEELADSGFADRLRMP